jgi:molecular chaperone GrpE
MYKKMVPADIPARCPRQGQERGGDLSFSEVEALRLELAAQRDEYLRLAADFETFRRRSGWELSRTAASMMEALVRDMLPVIDHLDRALAAWAADTADPLRHEVEVAYQRLLQVMRDHGFWPREDLGRAFDPNFHEAVCARADPDHTDREIVEVRQRGWMHEGRVLRPAKVVVNDLSAVREVAFEATGRREEALNCA